MRLPDFLIIGAPRCGTTWLAKSLASHPEVFMPAKKELHFFDRSYDQGIEHYATFFEEAGDARAVGEATPSYLFYEGAAERIRAHLPAVKLILILRDPVDRLVSRYLNIKSAYAENRHLSLFEKLEQKPEIIYEGLYYTHLTRYYELFDQRQVLVSMYSDIRDNPEAFLRDVYRFLEIEEGYVPPIVSSKINSARSKPHVGRFTSAFYLARLLRRVGFQSAADRIHEFNALKADVLTDEERRQIYDRYFRREMQLLETEYGLVVSV